VIVVVTGGNAQAVVGRSLAPLVRDGQVIVLIQGNTGGSLIVRRALDAAGCRADVDVAEMDNYPYSFWRLAPTRIRPIVKKRCLLAQIVVLALTVFTEGSNLDGIGRRPPPSRFFFGQ
jgi:hypothetical protein